MPELSNLPIKTKYTPGDRVIVFDITLRKILSLTISEWRVEVDNPLNDTTGRQIIFYKFEEVSYEIQEKYVFASENHCLSFLNNDYFNRAIESTTGGNSVFKSGLKLNGEARSFGNWTDFAGWDMGEANFIISEDWVLKTGTVSNTGAAVTGTGTLFETEFTVGDYIQFGNIYGDIDVDPKQITVITDDTHLTVASAFSSDQSGKKPFKKLTNIEVPLLEVSGGENTLIFDNCRLGGAILPDSISDPSDSWADFRANVRSYDADTTIMPDSEPIGRPA